MQKVNMDYCKYENTVLAMKQCYLTDFENFNEDYASKRERKAYKEFLQLIIDMADVAEYLMEQLEE